MAAPRFIQTVSMPTEYERQAAEARRRQALAEALEAQAYQPLSGSAAPTPSAAPLVMALQSFLSARQRRKAEEAGEQATQMEQEFGRRIAGRLEGGYVPPSKEEAARVFKEGQRTPEQVMAATPAETTLQEVTPTAQYRKAPQEALSMAMTPLGMSAMKRAPLLAAALEKSMETPAAEEFGTNIIRTKDGKGVLVGKRGTIKEVDVTLPEEKPEAVTPVTIIKNGRRVVVDARTGTEIGQAPSEGGSEPLMLVDVNGVPTYTPRSQAVGKQAYVNKPSATATGDAAVDRRAHRSSRVQLQNAYDAISDFAKELQQTPKEESLVGERAGRLSSKYKLALGAVRVLQNTGVLNPGELPFIEDTLRNPQSLTQLFNPASRETILGQIDSIADSLERQSSVNDESFGYKVVPLKGREWRQGRIPAKAVAAGLTQADWDAATEDERAAWR